MNPSLEVKDTGKYGGGIYVREKIKQNERLAVFGGHIMTIEQESALPEEIKDLAHQIDDNLVIGIRKVEDKQDVDNLNHSCEPNAGFNGQIFLVAMRDIDPGEEVTFDYAMVLGGGDSYKLDCLCGKNACRKEITNEDWKNPKLQEKYRGGYFQWYLEEKIKKA